MPVDSHSQGGKGDSQGGKGDSQGAKVARKDGKAVLSKADQFCRRNMIGSWN